MAEAARTTRWGLGFEDAAIEARYRDWYIESAVSFCRLGMVASAIGWFGTFMAEGLTDTPYQRRSWFVVFAVMMPLIALGFGATYPRSFRRWLLPVTAAINGIAGVLMVWWIA
jgi:hypothetical protein